MDTSFFGRRLGKVRITIYRIYIDGWGSPYYLEKFSINVSKTPFKFAEFTKVFNNLKERCPNLLRTTRIIKINLH